MGNVVGGLRPSVVRLTIPDPAEQVPLVARSVTPPSPPTSHSEMMERGDDTAPAERAPRSCTVFVMTPPNEHTSEGGRDDRGVPYHAESTLSSAQVLKCQDNPLPTRIWKRWLLRTYPGVDSDLACIYICFPAKRKTEGPQHFAFPEISRENIGCLGFWCSPFWKLAFRLASFPESESWSASLGQNLRQNRGNRQHTTLPGIFQVYTREPGFQVYPQNTRYFAVNFG